MVKSLVWNYYQLAFIDVLFIVVSNKWSIIHS